MSSTLARAVARCVSSGFGSGYAPKAPGTFGSAAALAVWYGCWTIGLISSFRSACMVAAITAIVGTWMVAICLSAEEDQDPQWIVIDEWAGLFIALCAVTPERWMLVLVGFVAFRLFDASKVFPVGLGEGLPGALGVMADDIIAGGLAALVVWGCAVVCGL